MRAGSALLSVLLAALFWACGNRIQAAHDGVDHDLNLRQRDAPDVLSTYADVVPTVGCGGAGILIGVVETWTPLSPDPRRAAVRRNIRDTYVKLSNPNGPRVVVRFFIGVNGSAIADSLMREADVEGDMVFVVPQARMAMHPYSILSKTLLMFQWAVQRCGPELVYVLKTNEHSFVQAARLQELVAGARFPRTNLVFGRINRRQPTVERGRPSPDPANLHNLTHWPVYPNGCGYLVSVDIARFLAGSAHSSELPPYEFEDRAIGLLLAGLALPTRRAGPPGEIDFRNGEQEIRPWGHCTNGTVVLHYQSHDRLVRRRYLRAQRGEPMCGEGYNPSHEVCARAEHSKVVHFECPAPAVLSRVRFASFGVVNKFIGPRYPWCGEGRSGEEPDDDACTVAPDHVRTVLTDACVGRSSCTVAAAPATFGRLDCAAVAKGYQKPALLATFECETKNTGTVIV